MSTDSDEIARKVISLLCEDNKAGLDKLLAKSGVFFLSPDHLTPLVCHMDEKRQVSVENKETIERLEENLRHSSEQ